MNRAFEKLFKISMCCNNLNKLSKRDCQSYEYNPEKIGDIVENYQLRTMTIGINMPDTKNIINESALLKIYELLEKFDKDDNLDAAVIHGIGGNFCKGARFGGDDLKYEYIKKFPEVKKPVLAAISGYATGFGFLLALMCDIRIAEVNAIIGIGEKKGGGEKKETSIVKSEIFPKFLCERLAINVGASTALDFILTCRSITGAQAFTNGFVVRSTEVGTALGQCVNWGKCISKFPMQSIIAEKNNLYSSVLKTR